MLTLFNGNQIRLTQGYLEYCYRFHVPSLFFILLISILTYSHPIFIICKNTISFYFLSTIATLYLTFGFKVSIYDFKVTDLIL